MNTTKIARISAIVLLHLGLVLAARSGHAQAPAQHTTDVEITLNYFLYDLLADCRPGFEFPRQYVEWSMVQGTTVVSGTTGILDGSGFSGIDDPRRPRQTCDPWAIGAGGDTWQPIDVTLAGRFATNGGPVTVKLAMYDDDGGGLFDDDDHLDLTRPGGDDVIFHLDPNVPGVWTREPAAELLCNIPTPGCTDPEGQWCGACNDAQACCDTGDPTLIRAYAFRGDGHGAGLSWSVAMTRRECTARRDVDSDRDSLLDDWELFGLDDDCDGTVEVPFHVWGANPRHKDLFLEYDACIGEPIPKQGIVNLKDAFAKAPVDAGGFANPDGQPGIRVWVDTGTMVDPTANEGVGTCQDGLDNDPSPCCTAGTCACLIDAADPDCQTGLQEAAGPCNDGIDNDSDGITDLGDDRCSVNVGGVMVMGVLIGGVVEGRDANNARIAAIEGTRGNCGDGVDNDRDGVLDANDPDCLVGDNLGGGNLVNCPPGGVPFINGDNYQFYPIRNANFSEHRQGRFRYLLRAPESGDQTREQGVINGCGDGIDNATNGLIDRDDLWCASGREDGTLGLPGDCYDLMDNDGDGAADPFDPECHLMTELPSLDGLSCWDTIDNGDGTTDDADPDCKPWGGHNHLNDNIVVLLEDDAGTLTMHELGHSLGLLHGGNVATNFKPNYLSVMNYLYQGGIEQDPAAMAESIDALGEDGAALGTCDDRIDNGGDGLIDLLDPQCRNSCSDGIDNDGGGPLLVDGFDPECRGLDLENDGIPEFRQLDYSPQRLQGDRDRSVLSPPMDENMLVEHDTFFPLDPDLDLRQDAWGDALNKVVVLRYLPGNAEGPAPIAANTCSDGMDNDADGVRDNFDLDNCRQVLTLPRTGEHFVTPIPVGFDWNNDFDVNDFVAADMDHNPEVTDETLEVLTDFDDWQNIHLWTTVGDSAGAPPSPSEREPTMAEIIQAVRSRRPADLVIDATTRVVPGANGVVTLAVEVENVTSTDAYGPVTLTLQGLPTGATATATGGRCWPENGNTVCTRASLRGRETWSLTFSVQSDLCSWRGGPITASVRHAGGIELNPEDNALEIEVGSAGVWPQWRQCPSHWGASSFPGPSVLQSPQVVWSGGPVLNTPVIDDAGNVYIADAFGFVSKMAPDGTFLWTQLLWGIVKAGPALTPSGTLVVATADGRIQGLSQETGARVWEYYAGAVVYGSIVVAGDRLYVATSLGFGYADSLIALTVDGALLWTRPLVGPVVAAPTVSADGTIYVAVDATLITFARLVAVSPTGAELWSRILDGYAKDSPVERDGRVYIGTNARRVYAFNAASGVQAWRYTVPCGFLESCGVSGSPLALGQGQLAVGVAGGRVHVIQDAGTTATLVRSIAASGLLLGGPRDSMVAGQNGIAYIGNRNAQLRALNLNTGTQVSLASMLGNAVGAVALDGQGHLYVGTTLGFLYRY